MFECNRSYLRSWRGPVLTGALLLACLISPAWAAGTDGAAANQSAAAPKQADADYVEKRISELHDKLQITEAQAGQWEAVARVMRGNAKAIETLVQEKRQNEQSMTALEDLRAYQEISAAQAKAAQKLADAFEVLYQTMPDDQKKLADAVFRQHKQNAAAAHK